VADVGDEPGLEAADVRLNESASLPKSSWLVAWGMRAARLPAAISSATSLARWIGLSTRPIEIAARMTTAASSPAPTISRKLDSLASVSSWKFSG